MQLNELQGDKNPRGRPRGHGIAWYLARIGDQDLKPGQSKKEALAIMLFDLVLNLETSTKDRITLASEIMDRLDGKAVTTNLNAEISTNPFDGIDTAKLEALKLKLTELKCDKP